MPPLLCQVVQKDHLTSYRSFCRRLFVSKLLEYSNLRIQNAQLNLFASIAVSSTTLYAIDVNEADWGFKDKFYRIINTRFPYAVIYFDEYVLPLYPYVGFLQNFVSSTLKTTC